jgi:hypothetical protein
MRIRGIELDLTKSVRPVFCLHVLTNLFSESGCPANRGTSEVENHPGSIDCFHKSSVATGVQPPADRRSLIFLTNSRIVLDLGAKFLI